MYEHQALHIVPVGGCLRCPCCRLPFHVLRDYWTVVVHYPIVSNRHCVDFDCFCYIVRIVEWVS